MMAAFALLSAHAFAQDAGNITSQVRQVELDNGLELLLVQRPGQPKIAAGWVARVGSANERPGITGISHLFEHMMFKGSPRIGTRDAALDDRLRGQLDEVREAMFDRERVLRAQVRRGETDSIAQAAASDDEMEALTARFQELIEAQRTNLIKDEFDQIYTEAGATGMNAFTNSDMTVYFINVPRNKLELWFWMESERLSRPVFREFYSERDVVFEERRLRTDSTPTGAEDEVFDSLFWRGHPYGWPVIGWPSDIAAITRAQAESFFDTYYAPNNVLMTLVGDFDEDAAIDLAQKYLGSIPAAEAPPPDIITLSTPLLGELTYRAEVEAPPSAYLAYRTTAFGGADDPALQVLAGVLSGDTGRLYKRLVLEEQVATSVRASADSLKYDGRFSVSASGKDGIAPDRLRSLLLEELQKVKETGISDQELEKVRNILVADRYRRLRDPFFVMVQLLYFEGLGGWEAMDSYYDRVLDVDATAVQSAAQKYLTADSEASRLYTRAPRDAPEDLELAGFDPQQRGMIDSLMQQLGGVPDEQLPDAVARLNAMREEAPSEAAPAIDYVLKKLRERTDAEGG